MTAEMNGTFEVEFERKSSSNLSSCEDRGKIGAEYNCIVHDGAEEIDPDAKEDGDASYVFVNGADSASDDLVEKDLDSECVVDPAEAMETEPAVEEKPVPEYNGGSSSGVKLVEFEELSVQKGDKSCVERTCNVEENMVLPSNHGDTMEGLQVSQKGDEIERSNTIEEKHEIQLELEQLDSEEKVEMQSELASSAEVEESLKSQITVGETVEHEIQWPGNEGMEELTTEVEANQEIPIFITETVALELQQLDNEKVEKQNELVSSEEVEESSKSQIMVREAVEYELQQSSNEGVKELTMEVEANQEALISITETVELKLQQLDSEEKVEKQNELVSSVEVEESPKSQIMVREAAEHELQQSSNMIELTTEVAVNQETVTSITETVELELQQLNSGKEAAAQNKFEEDMEQSKLLEFSAEIKENREPQRTLSFKQLEEEKLEMHHHGEEVEEHIKFESAKEEEENLETQTKVTEAVEPNEFDQQQNSEGKAKQSQLDFATEVEDSAEIPLEHSSEGPRTELEPRPEAVIVDTSIQIKAVNDSDERQEKSQCPIGEMETELESANRSARNIQSFYCPTGDLKLETEVESTIIEHDEWVPADPVDDPGLQSEVVNYSQKKIEASPTCPVDKTESETEVRNPSEVNESLVADADDRKSENVVHNGSVDDVESITTCPANSGESRTVVGNGSIEVEMEVEDTNTYVVNASTLSLPTYNVADVGSESEVGNIYRVNEGEIPTADVSKLEVPVQFGSFGINGSVPNCSNNVIDIENGGHSTTGESDGKKICQESEDIEVFHRDESPRSSSHEGSTADASDEQKVEAEVGKRPFHFLIKVPRHVDDKIKEQIRLAQLQVDEKTKNRDAIRAAIQVKRASCSEYRDKFEGAKSEERAARDALNAKRQEIDSLQSAISIDDIDDRIHKMEHMIEHETMPLKEEKQLIREIKQLKQLREQHSSNMGRQDELQQAVDRRDNIEVRFKLLKQEIDSLRRNVLQTEGITKAVRKIYFEENERLRDLQAQFKAADDLRQEAYTCLQNLKKEFYDKNKYFRMYKDDLKVANDFASSRDKEGLQRHCLKQVDTIMELWNKNDEFRNEYVRCNTLSTLRRLRTLDGRSLGPDEEPPVLHNAADEIVDGAILASSKIILSTSEQEKSVTPSEDEKADFKSRVKVEQKNIIAKSKVTKPATLDNSSVTVSGREVIKEVIIEENIQTKEEEELARKAEELRKEEAAARLKEQRRLEEKAQARAELRAQKEAELKEKEREKRARKKERKKAATEETTDGVNERESSPSSENTPPEATPEPEIKEKPPTVAKRPQRPSSLSKQIKTKPLPPPLRNRGKRRMQTWMWVLVAALLVLALFLVGNIGFSYKLSSLGFGF
uniref:Uncharacterized protein n=1 Tax=Nelumbo nucifera TaxID=4432 RepID=A0A822ZBH8_NELNU|nr:TPA_asm: hypothetical protein HUJ06_016226 [Nelumbo nucifera]